MPRLAEKTAQYYGVRREVSQPADLAMLFLARMLYDVPPKTPRPVLDLVRQLKGEPDARPLERVNQQRGGDVFKGWLRRYLMINETIKGTSFYPLHPALAMAGNGEGVRVELFIAALARSFTLVERDELIETLWADERLPPFELMLRDLIRHQLTDEQVAPPAAADRFEGCNGSASPLSVEGILARTREDLLTLSRVAVGVQAFVVHAGRLLAFALSRYLLARAGVDRDLPIYAAPAADSHQGVKALAHEIIELHRARLEQQLKARFLIHLAESLAEHGITGNPATEQEALMMTQRIFDPASTLVRIGQYPQQLADHGNSFAELAYSYYWSHSGAAGRFLRQLYSTHLNLAKKAGYANSRSQNSRWHFYWLAPSLVETLLFVSQPRFSEDRVLVTTLLHDWHERYGIAVFIDQNWSDAYRHYFPGMGSPEAMNEANQRRFTEILAERGRLHKNSDDFPWVILKE
jgi:hypothetical protein